MAIAVGKPGVLTGKLRVSKVVNAASGDEPTDLQAAGGKNLLQKTATSQVSSPLQDSSTTIVPQRTSKALNAKSGLKTLVTKTLYGKKLTK